jgi:hypothetical protein
MKDIEIPFDDRDSAIARINFMSSNADEVLPDYWYSRKLPPEEIAAERETFADASLELARLQAEKAELVAEINARIKRQKKVAEISLATLRTGRVETRETVYVISDHVEGMVGTYNQFGALIAERTMRKGERTQPSIFNNLKTGTDE